MTMIKKLLAHPLSRGLDIDSPETTQIRAEIIQSKPFLKKIYLEWYQTLLSEIPSTNEGQILEIGSGGGFIKKIFPEIITSDIFYVPNLNMIFNALHLPFSNNSLKAIVMTNVLHHIPNANSFFQEAARCVIPGGVIAMIEPWVSSWSRFVYTYLHHEPFNPDTPEWDLPNGGPLSSANGALPWIILERDLETLRSTNPEWEVQKIELMMPFRYLASGGVSLRTLMPFWTYNFWKSLEGKLQPKMNRFAMFAKIVVRRSF